MKKNIICKALLASLICTGIFNQNASIYTIHANDSKKTLDTDKIDDIPVRKDILPYSNEHRPGTSMTPKYITIHNTDNNDVGANAFMHSRYLHGVTEETYVSWHFTVDDNEIIEHLPLNEIGYHAGDGGNGIGNTASIAIEICENNDGDYAQAEKNTTKLVAELLYELNMDITHVVPHKHWSGKACPHNLLYGLDGSMGWDSFIKEIQKQLFILEIRHASINKDNKSLTIKTGEVKNLLLATDNDATYSINKSHHNITIDEHSSLAPKVDIDNKAFKYAQTAIVDTSSYDIAHAKIEFQRLLNDKDVKGKEIGNTIFDSKTRKFTDTGISLLSFTSEKGDVLFIIYNYILNNPAIISNTEAFLSSGSAMSAMNLIMNNSLDVKWSIKDKSIAMIKDGKIIGKKKGNTMITGEINGIRVTREVNVL